VGDTRLFSTGMASEIDPLRCWLSRCKLYSMLGVLIECLGVLFARTSFLRSWSNNCKLLLVRNNH
jgi:hypothetical protein